MKILTTQNLNSLVRHQNSTNSVSIPNEIRNDSLELNSNYDKINLHSEIMFKEKAPNPKDVKKIIKLIKKEVGSIKKKTELKDSTMDKILKHPITDWCLEKADAGPIANAFVALLACAMRAATILAMSNEGNKDNNAYAVSHSIASGLIGFGTSLLFTRPIKSASDKVMKDCFKHLKKETLERLYPHLDIAKSDFEKGILKNKDGLRFDKEIKNCDMLPKFVHISETSEETFETLLNAKNIDWAAQKGKSYNEVTTRDGKKLYDIIDDRFLGILVDFSENSGKKINSSTEQILLRDLNEEFLKELVENADENSIFRNLDIASVYKNGKVQDFREWKNIDGQKFELDLGAMHVCSPFETNNAFMPRIDGTIQFDEFEKIHKTIKHQRNGNKDPNNKLYNEMGSKITTEMLIKAKESEGLIESIKWIPSDIVIRIPMAAVTIELIPWLLKNCFGIEKKKKPVQNNEQKNNQINNNANNIEVANNEIINNNEPSFKGSRQDKTPNNESSNSKELSFKGGKNNLNLLEKALKNILECTPLANFCAKLSKIPGGIIPAMITAGSVLTSSTYIGKTLTKKSLDKDNRTTLAINQGFCCIIPAIAAYTIENLIKKIEKKLEYRYSGLNQNIAARDLLQGNIKNGQDRLNKLSKCVKGFRSLKTMVLFTIIYRYLTPVLVTPLANKIGDKIAANKAAKKLA